MRKNGSPLQFPMTFPLKVVGYNTADFELAVRVILRKHVPHIEEDTFRSRTSSGDKYLAITATFTAHNRAQLDAIYRELNSHELVVTTL